MEHYLFRKNVKKNLPQVFDVKSVGNPIKEFFLEKVKISLKFLDDAFLQLKFKYDLN